MLITHFALLLLFQLHTFCENTANLLADLLRTSHVVQNIFGNFICVDCELSVDFTDIGSNRKY